MSTILVVVYSVLQRVITSEKQSAEWDIIAIKAVPRKLLWILNTESVSYEV